MQEIEKDELLTTTEMFTATGVCSHKLNKWIENGYIQPKAKNDKGKTLISVFDVIKYKTSHPIKNRNIVWDGIIPQKDEDFRLIEGYDDRYAASKKRIVNFTSGKELEIDHERKDGYIVVYLQKDGVSIPKYAHTITCELFCANKRKALLPNVRWETHHDNIGIEHRKDINPDDLTPVTDGEHIELHRLWNAGKTKEYWRMLKRIKKLNGEEWFKILHPDYKSDEQTNYYMFLSKKGYQAYKQGKGIPLDSIKCESAEAKDVKR